MATFYTSDWHLNEKRIFEFNPFFRPFKSIKEQNDFIIDKCNSIVGKGDTLWHLGDVAMDEEGIKMLDRISATKRYLIVGNYDEGKLAELANYFDEIFTKTDLMINGTKYHLNHYPLNAIDDQLNLVGHIHGLWKVQPNMINVGVDAWNYEPLDEARIKFVTEAIQKHYDGNVFPLLEKFK